MIVHANYRQFAAEETIGFPRVESRMLLWGKSGGGWITVNGQRHRLMTGDYLFLPWGHRILYEADEKEPFWVGGIHLIPQLKGNRRNEFGVSHRPGDAWAGRSWRKDMNWPQLQGGDDSRNHGGGTPRLVDRLYRRFFP